MAEGGHGGSKSTSGAYIHERNRKALVMSMMRKRKKKSSVFPVAQAAWDKVSPAVPAPAKAIAASTAGVLKRDVDKYVMPFVNAISGENQRRQAGTGGVKR